MQPPDPAAGPRWKPGDRILIEAVIDCVADGSNWPVKIRLRHGEAELEPVDAIGNVHFTAIRDNAVAEAEARGYERGFKEAFVRGVRAIGDIWSHVLSPILAIKAAMEDIERTHDWLFDAVEGRAEGAPSLFDVPPQFWTMATGDWPRIRAAIEGDHPLFTKDDGIRAAIENEPVVRAATDLVRLWQNRVNGMTVPERAAALDGARRRLIEAVEAQRHVKFERETLAEIGPGEEELAEAFSVLERAAAAQWRADNPGKNVFACDAEEKIRYRQQVMSQWGRTGA